MTVQALFLFVHVLGIVLWIGLGVALPFITGRARREGDLEVVAFAYRTSDRLMRTLGLAGMVLTLAGGVGLVESMGYGWFRPFPHHWLFQMEVLGIAAFAVGLFYQIPLGGRVAREAEASAEQGQLTDGFRKYRKRNAITGAVMGFVLLVVLVLGAVKPGG